MKDLSVRGAAGRKVFFFFLLCWCRRCHCKGGGGGLQLLFMLLSLRRNIRAEGLGPPEGSVSAQCVHPP